MAAPDGTAILELLRDIERRSREHAHSLPEQSAVQSTRAGIGFRIADALLVAPLGVIREILTPPRMTRIPGAKPWMLGIANVRGNLLPVTDLGGLLCAAPTPRGRSARVLVVDSGRVGAGLLVDEVLGLRHFFEEEFREGADGVPAFIRPFTTASYRQGSQTWGSADLHGLIESEAFMNVAA